MTRILISILTLLLISSFPVFSQSEVQTWRYEGPRVGLDLSRFLLPYMGSAKRNGWEIQGDIPYKGNYFPTFETGMQWLDDKHDNYHYKNNGTYARLGIDMNIVKFESLKDHDIVFLGVRYGYSAFKQSTDSILTTNYWGAKTTSLPSHQMSAQWAEFVFGMKGELFPNLFFGWTVRAKFPFYVTKDQNIDPYIIPGIGKIANGKAFDFSVGVYYRFPIFKSKSIPKPLKMGGAKHPGLNNGTDQDNEGYGNSQSGGGSRNFNGR